MKKLIASIIVPTLLFANSCASQPTEPTPPTPPAQPIPPEGGFGAVTGGGGAAVSVPGTPGGGGGGFGGGGGGMPRVPGQNQAVYTDRLQRVIRRNDAPERSLVVPKNPGEPKTLAETDEDLNVMARILEKAASARNEPAKWAMGMMLRTPFESGGAPRNMYLEGYGALFFLNVNYPLLPPPPKKEEAEAKEENRSEWEEARRELRQPAEPMVEFNWAQSTPQPGPGEDYEPGRIEELQRNLIGALKNAAHIRALKSDENVVIVVNGRAPGGQPQVKTSRSGDGRSTAAIATIRGPAADAKGSRLVIRAKRSDIEAFQKDKLNLDEFRKKVTVGIY